MTREWKRWWESKLFIPVYPEMHWQSLLPSVSVQFAFELHPPLLIKHSLIFTQVTPSPEYPDMHAHVLDPSVFEHIAVLLQPPFDFVHSLISLQSKPFPKFWKYKRKLTQHCWYWQQYRVTQKKLQELDCTYFLESKYYEDKQGISM